MLPKQKKVFKLCSPQNNRSGKVGRNIRVSFSLSAPHAALRRRSRLVLGLLLLRPPSPYFRFSLSLMYLGQQPTLYLCWVAMAPPPNLPTTKSRLLLRVSFVYDLPWPKSRFRSFCLPAFLGSVSDTWKSRRVFLFKTCD